MICLKEKEELIALARKRRNDPVQEQLMQQKDVWNASASSLITKLIAFKRAMNGRQDPKFNLPVTKIQNPFPSQVGEFLNKLSEEYTQLVSGAEKIIDDQENYSQHRRLPKPKLPQQSAPPANDTTTIALPQQAAADDGLISEAGVLDFFRRKPDTIEKSITFAINRLHNIQNYLSSMDPGDIALALNEIYEYQGSFELMKMFIGKICESKGLSFTTNPEKSVKETKQQKEIVDISFLEKVNDELPYIDTVFEAIKKNLNTINKKLFASLSGSLRKAFSGRKSATSNIVESAKLHYAKLFELALAASGAGGGIDSFYDLAEYLNVNPIISKEPGPGPGPGPGPEPVQPTITDPWREAKEFVEKFENETAIINLVKIAINNNVNVIAIDKQLLKTAVKDLRAAIKTIKIKIKSSSGFNESENEVIKLAKNSYNIALTVASRALGKPTATSFLDFEEKINEMVKGSELENNPLVKLAHNMLSRYLKKKILENRPLFWSKSKKEIRQYRVWTIESLSKVEKILNDFLLYLKSGGLDPEILLQHFVKFALSLSESITHLAPLVDLYIGMARVEYLQKQVGQHVEHKNLNMGDVQRVRGFMNYLKNLAENARLAGSEE